VSRLSDRFAESAVPGLKDELGSEVTYTAPDGTQTTCTALVDEEETLREQDSGGQALRRVHEVTIFKVDVAEIAMKGKVTIGSDVWSVESKVAESEVATVVELKWPGRAEVSRPGFREQ